MPEFTGATWRKSSRSGNNGCVEIADLPDVVAVRDSKDLPGPTLAFGRDAWAQFLAGVKADALDHG